MKLIIGNKNYSSWSLRPWLALAQLGVAFEEILIRMDQPETRAENLKYSANGKVPALHDGDVRVWETLAILEYLNERFPDAGLWPADPVARALARSISNEMHAGFAAFRNECPMNLWRPVETRKLSPQAELDRARVEAIWRETRARYGQGGPFLFGTFTNADAMFAPMATRFRTYGIKADGEPRAYVDTIHNLPSFQRWHAAALAETWEISHDEVDWPVVKRV